VEVPESRGRIAPPLPQRTSRTPGRGSAARTGPQCRAGGRRAAWTGSSDRPVGRTGMSVGWVPVGAGGVRCRGR